MTKNTSTITSKFLTKIEMGVIELRVKNIEQEMRFYVELVGLNILHTSANTVTLGYQQTVIIRLHHTADLERERQGSAGLYHLAILFKSRASLAQAVARILTKSPDSYSGSADHLVSEAFYFTDPEGNGVELYFDTDISNWQWIDGKIVMASSYIDPDKYIIDNAQSDEDETKVTGHIHLKVGDINQAKEFYINTIGMSITHELPTALFLSDGEYHHHLGLNIWESNGAVLRDEGLGLHSFEIIVTQAHEFEQIKKRLQELTMLFAEEEKTLKINDPWKNTVNIKLKNNN